MTAPDLSFIIPLKYKTYVSLIGSALSFVVPFALEVTDSLPAPWPALVGCVLFLLSALGVYKAPYKPAGTVLAPAAVPGSVHVDITPNVDVRAAEDAAREAQKYQNPWR